MLAALEQRLADEPFVVIGVHSPKFPTERDEDMVRQAVRRHGVAHPVVVDSGRRIWEAYAVRAWPTLVLVRPDGVIAATSSGEPEIGQLTSAVRRALRDADPDPDPLPLAPPAAQPGRLAFPGGIAVGPDDRIYVADTGHHQVVELAADGGELRRFGDGRPGLVDGPAEGARFHHPRGLAWDGEATLVVADTGAHAVRELKLASGMVRTLAGTGRRGRGLSRGGPALATDLRSPWDVAVEPSGDVIVAMAGSHQLWSIRRAGGGCGAGADAAVAGVRAGSGAEALVDGDSATAAFAQPSGLAWGQDGALFVADSESSAIRRVTGSEVRTVAGGGLFAFGLSDAEGEEARFQHPVGIASAPDGLLYVADTLNHAVRSVDPSAGRVRTVLGDGTALDAATAALERRPAVPGDARRQAFAREPEALAHHPGGGAGGRLLVVDTGNHRVLAVAAGAGQAEVLFGPDPRPASP